ncbi:MAG: NADH:ubiquinone oxidoreductase subunit N, partial [Gammaproteobacteria bacterium]|nr:NADH:ubiquinone oxidoreductase subunit N [Gammaproteobacteria bacterium]
MNTSNMLLAAPEFWVLTMACVILITDLFISKERRGIIHMMAMITLIFAAIITLRGDYLSAGLRSATAFTGSFIRDPMGDVLKLFSYFVLGMVYIYAKFCLRQFRMFRADFYTLSLFALLGVMLLISANSLVTIYLGLELTSLSTYALVAFDRESKRG